jgi:hypothetical protein
MQITPRVFALINLRSLACGEKQRRGGWPNPGERGVAGGEARGGGAKGVQAAPLCTHGSRRGGRRRRISGGRRSPTICADGGTAPVGSGRGGGAGKLHEVEAQLMEGSAWAERSCSGGFTSVSSSPAFGWSGGGILGSRVGEKAKERGERVAGVFVVLLHARGESGGLYPVLSMAAVRWRLAAASG